MPGTHAELMRSAPGRSALLVPPAGRSRIGHAAHMAGSPPILAEQLAYYRATASEYDDQGRFASITVLAIVTARALARRLQIRAICVPWYDE